MGLITLHQPKLHEKARRGIERLITDRGNQPGARVPSERELARELYISLTTIRTALKALEQEGRPRDEAARFEHLDLE